MIPELLSAAALLLLLLLLKRKRVKNILQKIKQFLKKEKKVEAAIPDNPAEIPDEEKRKPQPEDLQRLVARIMTGGFLAGTGHGNSQKLAEDAVNRLVELILKMDLPIFKIAKKRLDSAKKFVPVKKFRKKVRKVPKVIEGTKEEEEIVVVKKPTTEIQEDYDVRPMQSPSEIKQIMKKNVFVLPRKILGKMMVGGQIPVRIYQRVEKEVKKRTVPTKEIIQVDEPYMKEYTEMMEKQEAPEAQLLYILIDGSGSMGGWKSIIAAALAISVIRSGMDNKSKFFYRTFDSRVSFSHEAEKKSQKEDLIREIIDTSYTGGGTDIETAIEVAGDDIKKEHKSERAEILLITDGGDNVDREWLRSFLGDDIILHTVMIEEYDNDSLKENSSTYVKLPVNLGLDQVY